MAMWKYGKRVEQPNGASSNLSMKDIEAAQKLISIALDVATSTKSRRKYNSYSAEQRAKIGKYAAENGPTRAARNFTANWGINVHGSTARRLKSEYLNKLEEISKQCSQKNDSAGEPVVVTTLQTKDRGRPVLLRVELDGLVQEFVNNLRAASGVVNSLVVMGATEAIVSHRDISKLFFHGGHIEITKTWAKSLLQRMGFVKRKCSTSGKISLVRFDESKDSQMWQLRY